MSRVTATIRPPVGTPNVLELDADNFPGFSTAEIRLSMDDLANGFSIDYAPPTNADKLAGIRNRNLPRPAYPGDRIEIRVDGDLILKGFVEECVDELSAGELRHSILGRSVTCDLIDCTTTEGQTWSQEILRNIVQDLCDPFGITVLSPGIPPKFPLVYFRVSKGEYVGDAIQRACNQCGYHAYCVGGDLVISRPGTLVTGTTLTEGFNLIAATATHGQTNLYSEYGMFKQGKRGTKTKPKKTPNINADTIEPDNGVERYRPLVQFATTQASSYEHIQDDMQVQLEVDIMRRVGASQRVDVEVGDPVMDSGYAWRPNLTVAFESTSLGIDRELLISTVTFRVEASSIRTEMTLSNREAYAEDAFPPTLIRRD